MSYPHNNNDGRRSPASLYPQLPPQQQGGYYTAPQQQQQQPQQQPAYNPSAAPVVVQGQPVYMHAPAPGTSYYAPPQQATVIYPPGNQQQYGGKMSAMEVHNPVQSQKPPNVLQSQPVNGPPDGGAGPMEEETAGKAKYQDVWAAILFLLHLAFIIYLAAVPGWKALMSQNLTTQDTADSSSEEPLETGLTKLYAGVAVVLAAAAGWSAIWTGLLLRYASNIITAAIWGGVATSAVGAVLAVLAGNFVLAIVCAIFGAIQAMWYYCIRNRIPFASMNLKCSATAVLQYPSILLLAGLLMVVQMAWALCWQLAAYGVAISKGAEVIVIEGTTFLATECSNVADSCGCFRETVGQMTINGKCENLAVFSTSVSPVILFFLLISFFWGSLVVKNVLFCSAAGTVGDWWYSGQGKSVVSKSFFRAATTSFGSICFGSLILAVLKALKEMLKQGRREGQRENAAACVLKCLLGVIERLMEIFNRYALVYCAVYGTGFRESGKKTCDLFGRCGFTAIINDDLAETALNLVSLVIGVLTGVVGYLYGVVFSLGESWPIVLAVIGFFSGFFLSLIVMSVLDAGVATIFTVFAEDPDAFQQSHPALHQELVSAWSTIGYDPVRRNITRI